MAGQSAASSSSFSWASVVVVSSSRRLAGHRVVAGRRVAVAAAGVLVLVLEGAGWPPHAVVVAPGSSGAVQDIGGSRRGARRRSWDSTMQAFLRLPVGGGCSPAWRGPRCKSRTAPSSAYTGAGSVQTPGSGSSGRARRRRVCRRRLPSIQGPGRRERVPAASPVPVGWEGVAHVQRCGCTSLLQRRRGAP